VEAAVVEFASIGESNEMLFRTKMCRMRSIEADVEVERDGACCNLIQVMTERNNKTYSKKQQTNKSNQIKSNQLKFFALTSVHSPRRGIIASETPSSEKKEKWPNMHITTTHEVKTTTQSMSN
jgi:hypothetical protein